MPASRMSRPRKNPEGYGVLYHQPGGRKRSLWADVEDNTRPSVIDEIYPGSNLEFAAEVGFASVLAMAGGILVMRQFSGSRFATAGVLAASMVGLGLATRNVTPRLSMPLMVGGFMTMGLTIADVWLPGIDPSTPINNTSPGTAYPASGAVIGAGAAQGYWQQRSSVNSGTSVVAPLG